MDTNTRYSVLDYADFRSEYRKAFEAQSVVTEAEQERFREKVFSVQYAIESELLKKWGSGVDFEMSWDVNYWYYA
ncbi:hypothetical protein [Thalassoglobus polymorphus]|nr:hypothetical protein [Thalassoglobus polymorphus]